jgi:hypothetical protein
MDWKASEQLEKRDEKQAGRTARARACKQVTGWFLALTLAIATGLSYSAGLGFAKSPSHGGAQESQSRPGPTHPPAPTTRLTITVFVYDYTRLDPTVLTGAQEVAAAIFKRAGLETAWIYCPVSPAELEKYPACNQELRTTDFGLRLLTANMAERLSGADDGDVLGFARPCPDSERGCVATIFYPRVEERASEVDAPMTRILGQAIVHELGHLLLGPGHSSSGIMQGIWSHGTLKFMGWNRLLFTPKQSGQLRADVARRIEQERKLTAHAAR